MNGRTVLIVEDEASIADSLTYILFKEGFEPRCCGTAREALSALKVEEPHLVILDIGLPDQSGLDLCREIRTFSSVPILFLTARSDEVDKVLGFEFGGDDYVTKPFGQRELLARIKAILRRSALRDAKNDATCDAFAVDTERKRILVRGEPLNLSKNEYHLLLVLIKRPGRVYSREELMNLVWDSPEMSLERTVDTHIKTIRAKIRLIDPTDDSIITHRGFGYSFKESR